AEPPAGGRTGRHAQGGGRASVGPGGGAAHGLPRAPRGNGVWDTRSGGGGLGVGLLDPAGGARGGGGGPGDRDGGAGGEARGGAGGRWRGAPKGRSGGTAGGRWGRGPPC